MKHISFRIGNPFSTLSAKLSAWRKKMQFREIFLWLVFLITLSAAVSILLSSQKNSGNWQDIFGQQGIFLYSLCFSIIYFLFLLISAFFFRRWRTAYTDDMLPVCTVLVPAYNEGRHVYDTITSLLASDYPMEKFGIIAINDGSGDDTLYWLNKASGLSPQVTVIDLKTNRGKKYALYHGIIRSQGEVIVTVDSDTVVRKDTVRQLVQPFFDDRVGAVAGSISGKFVERNLHTRMLDVMLVFGCEFLRRAQSASGNVFCTPGALSAYRRSVIMPLIDQWLNQTFLGQVARIGEDRAIATLILCSGSRIVYQPLAMAETCLPDTYGGVCKMLLRWTRSDIRENIVMSGFVLKQMKHLSAHSLILFIHWIALFVNMLLPCVFIPAGICGLLTGNHIVIQLSLIYVFTALWSLIPTMVYFRKNSLRQTIWALFSGIYSILVLSWISIYSVFTLRNSNWLTRELKKNCK